MNQASRIYLGEPLGQFKYVLLRGALGGAAGGFALVAGVIWMMYEQLQSTWLEWLVIAFILYGLPIGAIVGAVVGIVISTIHSNWVVDLVPIVRFCIGLVVAMTLWGALSVLESTKGFNPSYWESIAIEILYFGVAVGGFAGLLSGRPVRQNLIEELRGAAAETPNK